MFNWISHVIDFTENNFVAIAFLDFSLLTCYYLLENPDEGKGSQKIDVQWMIVLTKVANQQNKQHGLVSDVNHMIEYIDSISKKYSLLGRVKMGDNSYSVDKSPVTGHRFALHFATIQCTAMHNGPAVN